MGSTQDLRKFIKISKIRPPNQSPHEAQEEDRRLSDEEMREAAVKAIEEARKKGSAPSTSSTQEESKPPEKKSEEIPMMQKEGDGGGGGLAGGGTVAVSSDPGVFTDTFGGGAKRRLGMQPKKKKKDKKDKTVTSGVTKVDRFLRGEEVNQSRKSVQDFAKWVVNEARVSMIQLDAKPENVNTNDINEPPVVASKKSGTPRNPYGRRGKQGLAPGQQGYTRPQFSHHFNKMEAISKMLESNPSVLSLLKALDTDVPIGVH